MSEINYSLLDQYFAGFMAGRSGLAEGQLARFRQLVQDLSAALMAGHSCLAISREEEDLLRESSLVSLAGATPLVLFDHKLYLNRYYQYEFKLAERMKVMGRRYQRLDNSDELLDHFFADSDDKDGDLQRRSARVSLERSLSIISGGPGTGKTSTVVKIIALLLNIYGPELKIALAAPTGKAAMRLCQSIEMNRQKHLGAAACVSFPTEAMTLHRLLGVKSYSPAFRHHRANMLDFHVVIIDEASMVDLAMMSKLVDALKPDARLILLGDKDQLASVESGSVLADLVARLSDNTTTLKKSYRFDATIEKLARLINNGHGRDAWSLLKSEEHQNVNLTSLTSIDSIGQRYEEFMAWAVGYKGDGGYSRLLDKFNSFKVLCAVRKGKAGVEVINKKVESYLVSKGYECASGKFYPGRPVMITRNDYSLDLYNGDVGITLVDGDGQLKVWFQRSDGSISGYLPHRLPRCETVFAMSIHKSQGSEFDEVLVVLPAQENRILSRELVYTAITRAKKRVEIMAEKDVFQLSIQRRVRRSSGLRKMLER